MIMEEKGFKKIDLTSLEKTRSKKIAKEHEKENAETTTKKTGNSIIKKILLFFIVLLVLVVGAGIFVYFSAQETITHGKEMVVSGKELAAALKKQDLDESKAKIAQTRTKLAETKKAASRMSWTGVLPFIGGYYKDLNHGLTAGEAGLDALEISLDAILPYADLLGLKGKGTFVGGSANERMQTAITTFEKVTPKLAEISQKIEIVRNEIDAIDPNRYPEKIRNQEVKPKLVGAKNVIDSMANLFISARPLLEELPKIMGQPEPKRYLVFFKNDKELRPDGGFITAYAVFRLEGGKPIVEKADDIYKLDESRTKKVPAPPEILKYHKGVYEFNLRDSNLSPDFVKSIGLFEDLYKDVPGKISYDGIMTVDTNVLVEAMKILGSFTVYDRTFSADNDPRCNCPKAVYELEDYSTKPVAYVRSDRKDIIGVLLLQVMQKALGVSPGQYWGRLFQMAIAQLNEKHILVYLKNDKAQPAIEALGWGGRIKDFNGDYLHINDANMAGAKSDLFVKRSAKVNYQVGSDGKITKTLTIDYKNPSPPSNCNLEAGQLCLNGLLRDWVRIYVPKGSKLVDFKGSEMDVVVKEDLGKTVFEGFVTVKPLGASQLVIGYTLPDGLKQGNQLPVLIQKQPGTEGPEYEIMVNGKTIEKFPLITDREEQLKL